MNKEEIAIKTNASTVAPKEVAPVVAATEIDYEARTAQLEAEKAKLISDNANYKVGIMKKERKFDSQGFEGETEEDRFSRIVDERLANSRLAQIAVEERELKERAFRENKELKQALMNKQNGIPTSMGVHSEGQKVSDTLVTPEQLEAFKRAGWSDDKINRYKRNLIKHTK